ncbi:cobalt-precorrin-6A reductase [Fulvimarina sp. 2208YS6-2-32]|uniref:Cobalt-precorrin-6A reductase n=1 Tax=Fulvimarina uroteuthidis TaxID=3098149 RepID=A0ABU5HXC3_9HYPH|nr:cobalt-precorrin-6A reductase [Fulvimarina sp. 2208YS6-2-32]MDY8107792.1 cobalt-precorrin-6A reductase [Fulvimarina sp. 2208YS6-2-32]
MPADRGTRRRILVLGGTGEANALAARLQTHIPNVDIILSLAGRTRHPVVPSGDRILLRTGGFGGVEGLSAYLAGEPFAALVDATHPFAVQIAANAAAAAARTGTRAIKLSRPPWTILPGDRWTMVADEPEAAAALPDGARPFIALGSQHLAAFEHRRDLKPVLRMIEPAAVSRPPAAEIVRAGPGRCASDEARLFRERTITHLVCRNAGGPASYPKIEAARTLGLEVVMIERPATAGPIRVVPDVEAAMAWISRCMIA